MPANVAIDEEPIIEAYTDVRADTTDTAWLLLKYDDESNTIVLGDTGVEYEELQEHFQDDARLYGYVKFITGDELSKRAKFVFISWVGPSISPLKRAKVSIDKAQVKKIVKDFAVEVAADEKDDLKYEVIDELVRKAGGANYGTGVRN